MSTCNLILGVLKDLDLSKMKEHIRDLIINSTEILNEICLQVSIIRVHYYFTIEKDFFQAKDVDIFFVLKKIQCLKSIFTYILKGLRHNVKVEAAQASASVQKLYSNVATVSMVQSFVCSPIKISQIKNSTCGSVSCSVKYL